MELLGEATDPLAGPVAAVVAQINRDIVRVLSQNTVKEKMRTYVGLQKR